jgi:hypothetical protein
VTTILSEGDQHIMATLTISYPASGTPSDPNLVPGDGFFAIWGVLTAGPGEDVMMAQFSISDPGANVAIPHAIDEASFPAATSEKKYWGFAISRPPANTTNPAFNLTITATDMSFPSVSKTCIYLAFGAAFAKPGSAKP